MLVERSLVYYQQFPDLSLVHNIPISQFSEAIQTICNIFPASQITIVLRNVLINGLLEHMNTTLDGVDQGMFVTSIKELFSFKS